MKINFAAGGLIFLKRFLKVLIRPYGFRSYGRNSFIGLPRIVRGRDCISIGKNSSIGASSWIEAIKSYGNDSFSPVINIGCNVSVGRFCTITATTSIVIGDNSLISEHVFISDHFHDVFSSGSLPLVARPLIEKGCVVIGHSCFLGYRAIVLPGVVLGPNCIVGAGSVVTKSFDAGSVIAGSPARLIRKL